MLMLHTESEIHTLYRQSLSKQKIIGVLAELNDCPREHIKQILGLSNRPPSIKPLQSEVAKPKKITRKYVGDKFDKQITELYHKGMADKQMAKVIKCSAPHIGKRRKILGLATRKTPYKRVQSEYEIGIHQMRMALYKQGKTDVEIGQLMDCHSSRIQAWRFHYKLPVNKKSSRHQVTHTVRQAMYDKGMTDKEMAVAQNCTMYAIYQWRWRNGKLKAN